MGTTNYILQESIKTKTRFIAAIPYSELKKLNFAQNFMHQFRYFLRRIKEIELNYDSLMKTVAQYDALSKNNGLSINDIDLADIDINRLLINFSSSLKFFADYLEKHFNNIGKQSKEYLEFKSRLTLLYDSYFSYRFCYNLRNYSQHYEFPLYYFKEERNYSTGKRELKIGFSKNTLLKDDLLKRKLGKDLEPYNEFFPLNPILYEVLKPINLLEMIIFQIYEDLLLSTIEYIFSYKLFATAPESIIEYGRAEPDKGLMKVTSKIIEIQLAEIIQEKLIRYKKCNFT